ALASGSATDVAEAVPIHLLDLAPARADAPCWQRSGQSLRKFDGLSGLTLGSPTAPRALAIYRVTPEEVRIGDLAGRDRGDLAAVATAMVGRHAGRRFMILNEPETSPVCSVLETLGFRDTLRQHEMAATLG